MICIFQLGAFEMAWKIIGIKERELTGPAHSNSTAHRPILIQHKDDRARLTLRSCHCHPVPIGPKTTAAAHRFRPAPMVFHAPPYPVALSPAYTSKRKQNPFRSSLSTASAPPLYADEDCRLKQSRPPSSASVLRRARQVPEQVPLREVANEPEAGAYDFSLMRAPRR
jgi:hypothetical protein